MAQIIDWDAASQSRERQSRKGQTMGAVRERICGNAGAGPRQPAVRSGVAALGGAR